MRTRKKPLPGFIPWSKEGSVKVALDMLKTDTDREGVVTFISEIVEALGEGLPPLERPSAKEVRDYLNEMIDAHPNSKQTKIHHC